jgi:hypothetical protein
MTFDGIEEKLKRSNENIKNLDAEVAAFFQEGKYPVLPEHGNKLLLEAIEYHKNRVLPLRFSVLAGEIVHHLRSCLDHIAWQFSSHQYRKDHFRRIEFPIFDKKPIDKESIARYERKVKGITDSSVRMLIESHQPYKAPDPIDHPLLILHKMDIFDKHRELILSVPTGSRQLPVGMRGVIESYQRAHPELTSAEVAYHFKGQGNLVPYISFSDFGRREIQPIVLGLTELHNHIVGVVKTFAKYIV